MAALSEAVQGPHAAHSGNVPLLNTDGFRNVTGSSSQTGRAAMQRKRRGPKMCNCKESKDQSAGTDEDSGEGAGDGTDKKPFQSEPKIRYPNYSDPNDETPTEICDKCNHHKKPPRGKKLAWRGSAGSWMYVPNSASEEDPPEEEVEHEETPASGRAPRTPSRSPTHQPSHQMLGGIPTPLSDSGPSAKRRAGVRLAGSNNKRSRLSDVSPTRSSIRLLRRPQHLGEYWSCSEERWSAMTLEEKEHLSHISRIEETEDGERAGYACRPCASAGLICMVYAEDARDEYQPDGHACGFCRATAQCCVFGGCR